MNKEQVKIINTLTNNKDFNVVEILDIKPSKSTNSVYAVVVCDDDEVRQIALSDHYALSHDTELSELEDIDNFEDFDEILEEVVALFKLGFDRDYLSEDQLFYGVSLPVTHYDTDLVSDMVGKKSLDRAIVDNNYNITKVELSHNNQVLTVVYNDTDTEIYTDYNPIANNSKLWISGFENEDEIVDLANELSSCLSPVDLRRVIFRDDYCLVSKTQLDEEFDEDDATLSFEEKANQIYCEIDNRSDFYKQTEIIKTNKGNEFIFVQQA